MIGISKYFFVAISALVFTLIISCDNQSDTIPETVYNNKNRALHNQSKINSTLTKKLNQQDNHIYTSTIELNVGGKVENTIQNIEPRSSEIPRNEITHGVDNKYSNLTNGIAVPSRYFSVTFDNDIFNNTDYYYTNGIDIRIVSPMLANTSLSKILVGFGKSDVEQIGLSLKQNIYTPTNPDVPEVIEGDRPFSAFLTIGTFKNTYNFSRKLLLSSEFNIGVLGPASMGGYVQTSIHDIDPVGWSNQIKNSLVIDYSMDIEKGLISSPHFETFVTAGFNAGSVFNNIRGGVYTRVGSFTPVYRGITTSGDFQYWFFVRANTKFVIYDATLQGGLFNNSNIYTLSGNQINRLVLQASAGIAFYYKGLGVELENFYISPEFNGAYDFRWGRIKVIFNI